MKLTGQEKAVTLTALTRYAAACDRMATAVAQQAIPMMRKPTLDELNKALAHLVNESDLAQAAIVKLEKLEVSP